MAKISTGADEYLYVPAWDFIGISQSNMKPLSFEAAWQHAKDLLILGSSWVADEMCIRDRDEIAVWRCRLLVYKKYAYGDRFSRVSVSYICLLYTSRCV